MTSQVVSVPRSLFHSREVKKGAPDMVVYETTPTFSRAYLARAERAVKPVAEKFRLMRLSTKKMSVRHASFLVLSDVPLDKQHSRQHMCTATPA